MPKMRLDVLLVEKGLVESRSQAQRLVMAGQVRVDGQVVSKPGAGVHPEARLEVESLPPYVSRGGEKLEAALEAFGLSVTGLAGQTCADLGASTGGFTDCLLQHGAGRVYAIDVGKGILDWRLRQDSRVTVMESTNARNVERLPEPVDLVTIDASFISLKVLLPVVRGWFGPRGGQVLALVKPQFEAGRAEASRGRGVIHDPALHRKVLVEVVAAAEADGYGLLHLARSPLLGPKGNAEFFAHLIYPGVAKGDIENELAKIGLGERTG
jgi:23S rRNA (cytidine1920-2'-O)/16S rRNA (cytidine1409-2'-O)-methyltransferase